MRSEERDDLDRVLDKALRGYADAEPRLGFEERLIRRIGRRAPAGEPSDAVVACASRRGSAVVFVVSVQDRAPDAPVKPVAPPVVAHRVARAGADRRPGAAESACAGCEGETSPRPQTPAVSGAREDDGRGARARGVGREVPEAGCVALERASKHRHAAD